MTSITRRNALAGAGAAAGVLAIATPALASGGDDAELVRLGAEFDRRCTELVPVTREYDHLHAVAHEMWKAKNVPFNEDGYFAVHDETGANAAANRHEAAYESLQVVATKIRELPASGFAGLAVKVRVVRFENFNDDAFDIPEKDMDWDVRCFHQFVAEIDRLAS